MDTVQDGCVSQKQPIKADVLVLDQSYHSRMESAY